MSAEHSRPISFGKFAALVIEVLGGGNMMEQRPPLPRCDETRREDDRMEWYVIFAHELEEFHIVVDPPIFVVLLQQVGSDRDVANRSIEPYIKYLLFELFDRYSHTPFQVTGDAFWLQAHVCPSFCYGDRVFGPFAFFGGGVDPFFKLVLDLWQIDEEMNSWFHLWMILADEAEVIYQFSWGIESFLALVALISSCIRELAEGTGSDNEPISEPKIAVRAVTLHHFLLCGLLLIVDVQEDLLGDLGVPLGACPSKIIKPDIEPFVHFRVDLEVMITYFLGGLLLLPGFDLSRSAVLISSTDVEHIRPLKFLEPRENISRQYTANDVSKMRHVVDIRKCGSNKDVVLVLDW